MKITPKVVSDRGSILTSDRIEARIRSGAVNGMASAAQRTAYVEGISLRVNRADGLVVAAVLLI